MARNQSVLTNWGQYIALRLAAMGLHLFPVNQNLVTSRAIGGMLYKLDKKHRDRGKENIARSMPELSSDDVDRIARGSMEHFLQLGVEVMYTTRLLHLDTWADHVKLNNLGPALDLLLDSKPTLLVTGHYGNWEVLGYLLATFGINLEAIARPIDNPLVNDWLLGVRERQGMKIITKWGATEQMVDLMESGGTLGFIADQNAGEKGMFVPFFGRLASTYKSIGLLALKYNAPVICGYARRLNGKFEYEVGTTDIIRPEEWENQPAPLCYLTARYTRAIEAMVRLAPEQYLWIHRRWKSRPRHERLDKPMPKKLRQQLEALPWIDDNQIDRLSKT